MQAQDFVRKWQAGAAANDLKVREGTGADWARGFAAGWTGGDELGTWRGKSLGPGSDRRHNAHLRSLVRSRMGEQRRRGSSVTRGLRWLDPASNAGWQWHRQDLCRPYAVWHRWRCRS